MSRLWGDSGRLACRLHRSRVSKAGELAALRFSAPYLAAETRALRTPCPSWLITLVRDRPANSSSGPNRACRFVQESAAAISDCRVAGEHRLPATILPLVLSHARCRAVPVSPQRPASDHDVTFEAGARLVEGLPPTELSIFARDATASFRC